MSAFVVSKDHIDALVNAGLNSSRYGSLSWYHDGEHHELTTSNASEVGSMLWRENVESVGHRYSPPGREAIYGEGWESGDDFRLPGKYREEQIPGSTDTLDLPEWSEPYEFSLARHVTHRADAPVAVLKAINCYEYQSCEHEGWNDSEAKTFCEALKSAMISQLPGYDDAAWEINA